MKKDVMMCNRVNYLKKKTLKWQLYVFICLRDRVRNITMTKGKNYFTKSAIPYYHGLFQSQGNLRMGRDQFWSRLILRGISVENYPSQKLEYLSPLTCYIASQGGKWKIFAICIFNINIYNFFFFFEQLALGKGLDCVEVGEGNQCFNVIKHKPKVWVGAIFCMILTTMLSIYHYALFFQTNFS